MGVNVYTLSASIVLNTDEYERSVAEIKRSSADLKADAAEIAAAYKEESTDASEALKKAWKDVDKSQSDTAKTSKTTSKEVGDNWESQVPKVNSLGEAIKAVVASEAIVAGVKKVSSAVLDIGKSAYSSYGEYEQLVGGSQLMFGDAYDIVAANAKNAYKTVQLSQSEYLQQANGFATGLKTAMHGNSRAAAELADKIITAEADVIAATGNSQDAVQNAFNGIMRNEFMMLDNLKLGITPTKEGFQSLIDKVNDWNAQNGRMTQYTIDNLADCQKALVDYVEMQGLSGQASREASGTVEGSTASMKAAWENLVTGLGDSNADVEELTRDFIDSVINVKDTSEPVIENFLGNLVTMVTTAYDEIKNSSDTANAIISATEVLAETAGAVFVALKIKDLVDGYIAAGGAAGIWASAQGALNTVMAAAPYAAAAIGIVAVYNGLKKLDSWYKDSMIAQLGGIGIMDESASVADMAKEIEEIDAQIAARESTKVSTSGSFGDILGNYFADSKRNDTQIDELKARRQAIQEQIETLTDAETAAKIASGELSVQSIEDAYAISDASSAFADSAKQIMVDYWNTYNSIYTNFFNASTLFTQKMEATDFSYKIKDSNGKETGQTVTGAQHLRETVEANTRFYEQYAADLKFVQDAAADADTDLSALNQVLASMDTEEAAGTLAAIREELEGVGQPGTKERQDVINNWADIIQKYSDSVNKAVEPIAQVVSDVKGKTDMLLDEYSKSIEGLDKSDEAIAAAKATLDALALGIDQNTSGVLANLDSLAADMQKRLTADFDNFVLTVRTVVGIPSATGVTKSHRNGLDYVPYDGYVSELHRGERVLTAAEARQYRNGSLGDNAAQPINITLVTELDGEQIGRAAYQYQFGEDRRNGY